MWEQKNKSPHQLNATLAPPTAATPIPRASTPHLRPHLCSLLPGPHIRAAQYAQTLIRITLRGRQGEGREMEVVVVVVLVVGAGVLREGEAGPVPDQAELPAPDYDTIFSAGSPTSSCFCEYGAQGQPIPSALLLI